MAEDTQTFTDLATVTYLYISTTDAKLSQNEPLAKKLPEF